MIKIKNFIKFVCHYKKFQVQWGIKLKKRRKSLNEKI